MSAPAICGATRIDVIERAAGLADQFGVSVDEALRRWEVAGGQEGGNDAGGWLSVAFLFARQDRMLDEWQEPPRRSSVHTS